MELVIFLLFRLALQIPWDTLTSVRVIAHAENCRTQYFAYHQYLSTNLECSTHSPGFGVEHLEFSTPSPGFGAEHLECSMTFGVRVIAHAENCRTQCFDFNTKCQN